MKYDSRRITISYLAVEELCKMFGLPQDVPTQALSAAVEKLIFQADSSVPAESYAIRPHNHNNLTASNGSRKHL
ncbi:hypothetical protein VB735_34550 [Halotia wernerae UHCC 0503]|jgi:hypothetical protein|uniref:hypothetical protein n=1 Tax=Nostoc sp. TCL26-01 TaxID=2576904 RepID=UPI0015BB2C17|nr:hypothetical protein [Nostoc sp. TCL26-01]MBW4557940.1 hypothetical protein [Trichormus sp. ATA11-4-KO1]MEA5508117.1 hypothetical protein [Halotia wernerae UHCC 0503]QLE59930.1 hypothetical protein FD725_31455 [Nostoc sp. TCL26-01]QLE59978.1 hypothetical protein FD725_31685 [Nostoc sp. TCL26-01]